MKGLVRLDLKTKTKARFLLSCYNSILLRLDTVL